jgi:hypothetical protein
MKASGILARCASVLAAASLAACASDQSVTSEPNAAAAELGGVGTPTNFHLTNCVSSIVGGKTYWTATMAWTRGIPSDSTQIFEGTTSSFASAAKIATVRAMQTSFNRTRLQSSVQFWYWVRHKVNGAGTGAHTALQENPISYTGVDCGGV